MAAAIAALREGAGGGILWVAVLVGLPVAFTIGYLTRRTRPLPMRIVQSVLAIAIMVEFLTGIHQLSDLAGLQVPLAQAFLWLLLLHALDTPNRHGLLVLLGRQPRARLARRRALDLDGHRARGCSCGASPRSSRSASRTAPSSTSSPRLGPARAPRFGRAVLVVPAAILAVVLLVGFGVFMLVPVAGTNRALTFPSQLPDDTPDPVRRRADQPVARRRRPVARQPGRAVDGTPRVVRLLRVLEAARHLARAVGPTTRS